MIKGIFLLLGSNLGNRKQSIARAREVIEEQIGPISGSSSIHVSSAWGVTTQPDFLNQVIRIESQLNPFQLLQKIQDIEIELGRVRYEKWGPRIIDIDILYYNSQIIESSSLKIPHPGIPDRRFTLEPLKEVAPDFIHPVLLKTNSQLLDLSTDTLGVEALLEA